MGRLPKAKIDRINRLYKEGYTKKEIAKKVGVTRGTVAKYVDDEDKMGKGVGKDSHSRLLQEIVTTLYDMLVLFNVMPYIQISELARFADEIACRLTETLAQISLEDAKRFMKNNPYIDYLSGGILDFSKPDKEMGKEELKQRKTWLAMMKKHHPEKLAELV